MKRKAVSILCLLALLFSMAVPAYAQDLSPVTATVNSDKLVTISGKADGAGKTVNILVKDPSGNTDYLNTCLSGADGVFRVSYTMTNTATGRYTVTVSAAGAENVASTSFLFGTNTLEAAAVLEGGLVKVSGIVGAGAGRLVSVRITAPDDSDEYAGYTMSGAGGGFNLSYTFANTKEGKYTVRVGASSIDAPVLCYFLSGIPTEVKAGIDKQKLVTVEGTVNSPEKPVSVRITDPQEQTEYLGSVPAGKDGKFSLSYTMVNETKGRYTVSVSTKGLDTPVTAEFFYGAGLADLTMSPGSLSPAFAPGELNYSAVVANSVTQVQVKPTATDPTAVISVNGSAVASGSMSAAIPVSVGSNDITVAVTERDASVTSYTLVVTREEPPYEEPYIPAIQRSSDASLSGLTLTGASLTEPFSSAKFSYTASVPNATASVTVSPTVGHSKSTVKVNGTAVTSGQTSPSITLNVGTNTITVLVTAEDGSTQTYTVTVNRAAPASAIASLSSLTLTGASLNEPFTPKLFSYTADAPYSPGSITVTPTVGHSKSTVTVNGTAVTSGQTSQAIPLNVGANTITVTVTAEAGNTQAYTITVTRAAPSTNASLSGLTLIGENLKETFSATNFSYTASGSYTTASVAVRPSVMDSKSTVKVNNLAVASGQVSPSIDLVEGSNTITVTVTAEAGNSQTYTITMTRASNAYLSGLTLAGASLNEPFSSTRFSYNASVSNDTTSVTVTPTVADSNSTVTVNTAAVPSGQASLPIPLEEGPNTITVVVTGKAGNSQAYTIAVTRSPSPRGLLSELAIGAQAPISPALDSSCLDYFASVSYGTTSTFVSAVAANPGDIVKIIVDHAEVGGGGYSGQIALDVGPNTFTIQVFSSPTVLEKTYTLTVTREEKSTDVTLSEVTITTGEETFAATFDEGTGAYSATVSSEVKKITVWAFPSHDAALAMVDGNFYMKEVTLTEGVTSIAIEVTAEDRITTKTYTLTVTRSLLQMLLP